MIHQIAESRGRFPSEVEALPVDEIIEMVTFHAMMRDKEGMGDQHVTTHREARNG